MILRELMITSAAHNSLIGDKEMQLSHRRREGERSDNGSSSPGIIRITFGSEFHLWKMTYSREVKKKKKILIGKKKKSGTEGRGRDDKVIEGRKSLNPHHFKNPI